jgi:signal peptidase II
MSKIIRTVVIVLILASNIGCDQVSKNMVRERINLHEDISIIGDRLILTRIENTGAFLSLGTNLPHLLKLILLTILPVIVLGGALTYLVMKRDLNLLFSVGLAFIVGGGIGNIYDRVLYGSVTDFLHIDLVYFRTGIFNMADVSVMVGMSLLILNLFINGQPGGRVDTAE